MLTQRCTNCGQEWWDAHACPLKIAGTVPPAATLGRALDAVDGELLKDGYLLKVAASMERCPHCLQLAPGWTADDLRSGWRMEGALLKHYHCREAAVAD